MRSYFVTTKPLFKLLKSEARFFLWDLWPTFAKTLHYKKSYVYSGRTDSPYQREESESVFLFV